MLDALKHRGPNDEGTHAWDEAIFGHRRLSIFDLSAAGHQPMLSRDGQIGVVLNGAIYNFRPLRAELEAAGYAFVSETDTEVLIHGYLEWGIDELIRRIDGMFAIGIWDDRRKSLCLLRGVPVQRWLTGKWKQPFVEMMNDSRLDREGWIRSDAILKLLASAEKQNWAPRQLWFILVLEAWLRFENE